MANIDPNFVNKLDHPHKGIDEIIEAAYRIGYIDAVCNYAVYQNGEKYVGVQEKPLQEVFVEFHKQQVPVRY